MKKALTYSEFIALAKANYNKGGDGYVECWDELMFDEWVRSFGGITKADALKMFEHSLDCEGIAEHDEFDEECEEDEVPAEAYEPSEMIPADAEEMLEYVNQLLVWEDGAKKRGDKKLAETFNYMRAGAITAMVWGLSALGMTVYYSDSGVYEIGEDGEGRA